LFDIALYREYSIIERWEGKMRHIKISSALLAVIFILSAFAYAAELPAFLVKPISLDIPKTQIAITAVECKLDLSEALNLSDKPLKLISTQIEEGVNSQGRVRSSV